MPSPCRISFLVVSGVWCQAAPMTVWSVVGMLIRNSFRHFTEGVRAWLVEHCTVFCSRAAGLGVARAPERRTMRPTLPNGCLCRTPGWNCSTSWSQAGLSAVDAPPALLLSRTPTALTCHLQPMSADPLTLSSGTELPLVLILAQSK